MSYYLSEDEFKMNYPDELDDLIQCLHQCTS